MATGWGPAGANAALDGVFAAHPWLQLHIGPPGPNGVNNVAGNAVRQSTAAAMAAASGGVKLSANATVDWTNVSTSEQYTHATLWSLAAGGTFGASGTVLANPVSSGDNFQLPVNQVAASLVLAS